MSNAASTSEMSIDGGRQTPLRLCARHAGRNAGEGLSTVSSSSPVLVDRLALLDERGHAFLLVLGGEGRVEEAALEAHALGERRLVGAVDRLLGHQHGGARH